MKKYLMALLFLSSSIAIGQSSSNSGTSTNSNNTVVIRPQINIKSYETKCKPKVIVKKEIVEKTVFVDKPVYVDHVIVQEKVVIKHVQRKNRISLLGGLGPIKLDQPSLSEVNLIRGPVFGAQYQRLIAERINLGLQLQTNQTALGSVGYDF